MGSRAREKRDIAGGSVQWIWVDLGSVSDDEEPEFGGNVGNESVLSRRVRFRRWRMRRTTAMGSSVEVSAVRRRTRGAR